MLRQLYNFSKEFNFPHSYNVLYVDRVVISMIRQSVKTKFCLVLCCVCGLFTNFNVIGEILYTIPRIVLLSFAQDKTLS